MPASYLSLGETEWAERLGELRERLRPCRICPRECLSDRREKAGKCRAPEALEVASRNLHFGEEPPITGSGGSGTIFVAHCNLSCAFCQNYPISQYGNGKAVTTQELAESMVSLQKRGAHNINFVSPTHYTTQLIEAVHLAREKGLTVPLVWNSNAYESVETLRLLEGIVDIYLPDIKYGDDAQARRISRAPDYWRIATGAVAEMFRQVGPLHVTEEGIATRGLLVRHLVLPNGLAGTRKVLRFIAEDLSPEVFVSLMSQYFPAHRAPKTEGIEREILPEEYRQAMDWLEEFGLENGFTQECALRFC